MINVAQMLMWSAASRISGSGGGGGTGTPGLLSSFNQESIFNLWGGNGSAPQTGEVNTSGTEIVIAYYSGAGVAYLGISNDGVNFNNIDMPRQSIPQIIRPSVTYPNRWIFVFGNIIYYCDDLFTGSPPTFVQTYTTSPGLFIQKTIMANDMWHAVGTLFSSGTIDAYYLRSLDGVNWTEYIKVAGGNNLTAFLMSLAASPTNIVFTGFPIDGYSMSATNPFDTFSVWTLNKKVDGSGNTQGVQGMAYSPSLNKFSIGTDRGQIYTSTGLGFPTEIDLSVHPTSPIGGIGDLIWNPTDGVFAGVGFDSFSIAPKILISADGVNWDIKTHPNVGDVTSIQKILWSPAYNKYYCFGQKAPFVGSFNFVMYIASFTN